MTGSASATSWRLPPTRCASGSTVSGTGLAAGCNSITAKRQTGRPAISFLCPASNNSSVPTVLCTGGAQRHPGPSAGHRGLQPVRRLPQPAVHIQAAGAPAQGPRSRWLTCNRVAQDSLHVSGVHRACTVLKPRFRIHSGALTLALALGHTCHTALLLSASSCPPQALHLQELKFQMAVRDQIIGEQRQVGRGWGGGGWGCWFGEVVAGQAGGWGRWRTYLDACALVSKRIGKHTYTPNVFCTVIAGYR